MIKIVAALITIPFDKPIDLPMSGAKRGEGEYLLNPVLCTPENHVNVTPSDQDIIHDRTKIPVSIEKRFFHSTGLEND